MLAVETLNLSRNFGATRAVADVSLAIHPGDIYALIGPNGAGKTTLIKMLVGLLSPTSGRALICGQDIVTSPMAAKSSFGYVPDNPDVYSYLTGVEFLQMTGNLRGMSHRDITQRISHLSGIFPIREILSQQMGSYSRGNRQKTVFLAALMSRPAVLFIDEPIAGLDPTSIEIFGQALTDYAADGGAVLLATHILSFGQKYANRVGVMSRGSLRKESGVGHQDLETIYDRETR